MNTDKEIVVLGAGVSGITMAISLLALGMKVRLVAREYPDETTALSHFPSLYPSASVIPHSVTHPDLNDIFSVSQSIFKSLLAAAIPGIKMHEHFELFTEPVQKPAYGDYLLGYQEFEALNWYPSHPEIPVQSGWKFNSLFADWSRYFPFLIKVLTHSGLKLDTREVDMNALHELPNPIVINCTGIGSSLLDSEPARPLLLRGHLLHIKDAPLLVNADNQTVSYNFNPGASFYANRKGDAQDLYCYPRADGWILGGSRQPGTLKPGNEWASLHGDDDHFPDEILKLNKEIIENSFGIDIDLYPERTQKVAYRYYRDKVAGLRLDLEERDHQLILHNYGNGGAGVTLSWGSTFRLLQHLGTKGIIQTPTPEDFSERLIRFLNPY